MRWGRGAWGRNKGAGIKTVIAEFCVSKISATSAERRLLKMAPRSREVADIFSPRLSSRQKNSAMTMVFFFKTKSLSSWNQTIVIAEFCVSKISATSAGRRLCFGRGKMAPRSREVADIFSPRLSSRQKNSAMTMIWSRDDNHGMRRRREEKNIFKKRPEFAIWRYNPPSVSFLCRPNAGDAWPDETIPVRSARFSKCAS